MDPNRAEGRGLRRVAAVSENLVGAIDAPTGLTDFEGPLRTLLMGGSDRFPSSQVQGSRRGGCGSIRPM